jgi:hypothetical protein
MTADYSITAAEWGQQRYDLQRNLTIASAPGHMFVLEFDFVVQGLRVPERVTVTLRDLALGRDWQAPGWSLPFFTGAADESRHISSSSSSRVELVAAKAEEAAAACGIAA